MTSEVNSETLEPHGRFGKVANHALDIAAIVRAQLGGDGNAPGRMNAAAERRKYADAPVAELIATAFHHDVPVRGNFLRGLALLLKIAH